MATESLRIEGLSATINRLQRLGRAFAADRVRPILYKGSLEFARTVENEAPSRSGATRRSVVARLVRNPLDIAAYTAIDFSKLDAKLDRRGRPYRYPYMVYHGVSPHKIRPRNGRVLSFSSGNSVRFARAVNHPGMPANPFFTRGFRLSRNSVRAQIVRDLEAILAAENRV